MGQKSTVELLPEDILEEVHRLIRDKATIEQIIDAVAEMGKTISRSAMGRYTKNLKEVSERLERSQKISNAMIEKLGSQPESKTARLNNELLHSVVTELVLQADDGEDIRLDPKAAHDLSKALDHLSRAEKTNAETIMKARKEAAKQAVAAATKTGKEKGLTQDTIDSIKASILGITNV